MHWRPLDIPLVHRLNVTARQLLIEGSSSIEAHATFDLDRADDRRLTLVDFNSYYNSVWLEPHINYWTDNDALQNAVDKDFTGCLPPAPRYLLPSS